MVRERGLEPPRPEGHQPLKLTRLPIPPFAHTLFNYSAEVTNLLILLYVTNFASLAVRQEVMQSIDVIVLTQHWNDCFNIFLKFNTRVKNIMRIKHFFNCFK